MSDKTTADAAARRLFTGLTGNAQPDGVWSAPGRANLIGEHTDYNDGFVLPFAIDRRTYAAAGIRSDARIRVASTFDSAVVEVGLDELDALFPDGRGTVPEWARYPLGVAWALRGATSAPGACPDFSHDGAPQGEKSGHGTEKAGHRWQVTGIDLAIASDVPVGAGLSSSAAIEGAVAAALNDLWSLGLDRVALAQAGRRAENEAVGAPTGIMDQMAAMRGRADAAVFLDCRSLDAEPVDLGFAGAGLELLVIDTRVTHAHSTGGYGGRRASCELGARLMGVPALRDVSVGDLPRAAGLMDDVTFRRVRHVVTEDQRVLDTVAALRDEGPRAIGALLLASHASMRDDFEISVPELDTAVEASVAAGALGARVTGGGFGGAAIALVEHDDVEKVTDAVTAAFAADGFAAPHCFVVTPSEGARREA